MATPLGLEKYGRIDFSPGRWTSMGQNASKLVLTHAKDQVEVGRNFFTFTFKAVGVTFLKVIFHLPRNAPIWSFWISLACRQSFHICHHQYFSHPSLTTVTFHSIVCHCMEDIGAKKNEILIKIWSELLYFLFQIDIFSF